MSAERAFGAGSVDAGAILPAAGRDVIVRTSGLPAGATDAEGDGWLTPEVPVLVRGSVKILPLAWWGEPGHSYNPYAEPQQIEAFAKRVQGAGLHHAGPWTLMELESDRNDSIGSYTTALREAGATRVDAWVYQEGVGVVLVWAGAVESAERSLAIHITPVSWVFERGTEGAFGPIDLSWSWRDVVRLYEKRGGGSQ